MQTTDWCRVCVFGSDILFENARHLAVPFLLKSHIYPRVLYCSCGNLICIVFAHFPLKNVRQLQLVHSNDKYKLHFSHFILQKGQELTLVCPMPAEDGRLKACCEYTNNTIMDIDLLQKRKSHWTLKMLLIIGIVPETQMHHKQTEQHTKESRERKRIYFYLIIVSTVLHCVIFVTSHL